jgi:hypothetical protein
VRDRQGTRHTTDSSHEHRACHLPHKPSTTTYLDRVCGENCARERQRTLVKFPYECSHDSHAGRGNLRSLCKPHR